MKRARRYWVGLPPAIRLTVAYVIILVVLCLIFSTVVYQFADRQLIEGLVRQYHQFGGTFSMQGPSGPPPGPSNIPDEIKDTLNAARRNLIMNLALFSSAIVVIGSFLSYWLAKRTMRPIEKALVAQSRFTADASHELRTPLAVMRTEIEIARADPKITKDEALALIDSNLEEVTKLHKLAEALLKLSRSNTQPIELTPISVAAVADDALAHVALRAKAAGITTINDVADFNVKGDQATLAELLVILLDNAIKYSPSGTAVTLGSKKQGNYGIFTVTDQGRGIDPIDVPRIFDRFYRADQSRTKADVEGHGLGLSIAQTIATVHGATIDVTSAPAQGSTFRVKLKAA